MLSLEKMRKEEPALQKLSDEQVMALAKFYYAATELALDSVSKPPQKQAKDI